MAPLTQVRVWEGSTMHQLAGVVYCKAGVVMYSKGRIKTKVNNLEPIVKIVGQTSRQAPMNVDEARPQVVWGCAPNETRRGQPSLLALLSQTANFRTRVLDVSKAKPCCIMTACFELRSFNHSPADSFGPMPLHARVWRGNAPGPRPRGPETSGWRSGARPDGGGNNDNNNNSTSLQ